MRTGDNRLFLCTLRYRTLTKFDKEICSWVTSGGTASPIRIWVANIWILQVEGKKFHVLERFLHQWTENINGEDNIRPGDGEIYETTNKVTTNNRIQYKFTIIRNQIQIMLHPKGGRLRFQSASVRENIQSVLPLIQKNTRWRAGNF